MKIKIMGDSHTSEMFSGEINLKYDFEYITCGGFGISSLYDPETRRPLSPRVRANFFNCLNEISEPTILCISHQDADARIAFAGRFLDDQEPIKSFYNQFMKDVAENNNIKLLIWLDIFSVIPGEGFVTEATVNNVDRAKYKQIILNVLQNSCEIPSVVITTFKDPLFENEEGRALPGLVKDNVHYNWDARLANEMTIRQEIVRRLADAIADADKEH